MKSFSCETTASFNSAIKPVLQLPANANMRRTASLNTLPSWKSSLEDITLHSDKSTQTYESYLNRFADNAGHYKNIELSPEIKSEKFMRQRWQRSQRVGGGENSVSIQTQRSSSPILIQNKPNAQHFFRLMRSSVEGLNQEIEKLVLLPSQYSRRTPEGHRAPVAELFHNDTRSVNTQTPVGDVNSSGESHSNSPEDSSQMPNASPRINRFLAREPPDGCEKVLMKLKDGEQDKLTFYKPCIGFQLKLSQRSAFQPLQPIDSIKKEDDHLQ